MQDYLTFKEFVKKYPALITAGKLRHILMQKKKNGSTYFYRRLGKNLLISPTLFFEWLDKQGKEE